jgi:hypothetical protein
LLGAVCLLVSEAGSFFVNRFFGFDAPSGHLLLATGVGKNRERV